jgi:hypothetical protein
MTTRRMRRWCRLAACLTVFGGGLAGPARAEAVDCGVRRLCLYSGVDWTGRSVSISERDFRNSDHPARRIVVDAFVRGRVSSWINTTSLQLCGNNAALDTITFRARRFARDAYVGDRMNNKTASVFVCGR